MKTKIHIIGLSTEMMWAINAFNEDIHFRNDNEVFICNIDKIIKDECGIQIFKSSWAYEFSLIIPYKEVGTIEISDMEETNENTDHIIINRHHGSYTRLNHINISGYHRVSEAVKRV